MTFLDPISLKQRALRAGGWSLAGQAVGQAIRLGSNLVMTRLLVPEMFGVMAIASMVTAILALLSDIGLRQNIVQSPRGDDPALLDTAWVVQIVRGVLMWCAALLIALGVHFAGLGGQFPLNSVYAAPELPLVIAASAFSAVIVGFQSTRMATALRRFDQKRIVQVDLFGQVVALVFMVVIGVTTRSIWALVAGGLVGSLTTTALSHAWMNGQPNRLRVEKKALRELMGFGKWVFVSSSVYILAVNGDRLLLGGYVDARTLGLYAIAILIVGAIESGVSRLFLTVALPALSEISRNDPSRLREVYYRLRMPGDLVLLFVAGLLSSTGQLAIDLLYDSRYSAAGGILEVLALSLFFVRYGVAHQLYLAIGEPKYMALISLVRFVSLYTSVPLLYHFGGLNAAIWGIALHVLPTVPLVYAFNAKLGLNDFRKEFIVLVALPAGYAIGSLINLARA